MSGPAQDPTPWRRVPSPDGHYEREVTGMSRQTDLANGVIAYLLAGPAGFGVLGWLLDRWLETRVFTLVGVLLGLGVAIYLVVVKYGAVPPPSGGRPTSTTLGGQRSRPPEYRKTQKGRR